MFYDAVTNSIIYTDEDDDFDARGLLKDGRSLKVRMTMMDSVQNAVATNQFDNISDEVELLDHAQVEQVRDWQKAELSARYKGGLTRGDIVQLGDRHLVVLGRNSLSNKLELRDASTANADAIKEWAYRDYESSLNSAWMKDRLVETTTAKVGGACTIDGERGVYRKNE